MTATQPTRNLNRSLRLCLALLLLALTGTAQAQEKNRLLRIKIMPHKGFTRINLTFLEPPDFALTESAGRVRIAVRDADAPLFRKYRAYSDANLGGVFCSSRQGELQLVVPVKGGAGVELVDYASPTVLSLDIGPALNRPSHPDIAPGREPILSGIERFVHDFVSPVPTALPFAPTDVKTLKRYLAEPDLLLFQRGEGALYKEQGSEALEVFGYFLAHKEPAVRALAGFRQAQALYLLERYDEALKAFKEAEALWPAYLAQAPELLQMYADLKARKGDFAGGRALLIRLIDRMSGTSYSAPLLNRLADLTARHGDQAAAREIYRSVLTHAPNSPAAARARLKLADRDLFTLSRDRYRSLFDKYQQIHQTPGDFPLRDEALFKAALLQSLYGPSREALDAILAYEARYPRGIFATIVKKMHEEILVPVYRDVYARHDDNALVQLALENREYLCRCMADPEFAPRVAEACRKSGKLAQELGLFGYLAERSWAQGSAPFLVATMVDDAVTIGNQQLAQDNARSFLNRFPRDARTQRMHEQLGRIAFDRGELLQAAAELSFLNGKGKQAELVESDYYLGKALLAAADPRGGERALARYAARAKGGAPLLPDTWLALATTRTGLKDYRGALAAYREGLHFASGEMAEQYLYKIGELYLQLDLVREAQGTWEELAKRNPGGTWGKLGREALNDVNWRLKIAGQLP
jgi:tetratricopeptide (TPR) repeat protein